MLLHSIDERYAQALYRRAVDEKVLPQILKDVILMEKLLHSSTSFSTYLASPLERPVKKIQAILPLLKSYLHSRSLTFVTFLIYKKRADHLQKILRAFQVYHKEQEHICMVSITTPCPISASLKGKVQKHVQQITQEAKIELTERVDPDLLGGYILKVDTRQLDMSLRRQLERLRECWGT